MSRTIATGFAALLLALACPLSADEGSQRETKASFLMNFAEFVEWPAGAFADGQAPIVLGVMGDVPFGGEIEKIQGQTVNGRKIEIKWFKGALEFRGQETPGRRQEELNARRARKLRELRSCHILFISASEKDYLPLILKPLQGSCVLTVGETELFARRGGIINFFNASGRIQIEINLNAAERAQLKISSKLLNLAKVIRSDTDDQPN